MEFVNPAVQAAYERIAPMMKELFGEFASANEETPSFGISMGSAYAQTVVYPWGDDDATIRTLAWVLTGAETTPELTRYLLEANTGMMFGAFGMDEVGDVLFQSTILAATCDKEELRATIMAVIRTADRMDDELVAKFGGQRAIDRGPL